MDKLIPLGEGDLINELYLAAFGWKVMIMMLKDYKRICDDGDDSGCDGGCGVQQKLIHTICINKYQISLCTQMLCQPSDRHWDRHHTHHTNW